MIAVFGAMAIYLLRETIRTKAARRKTAARKSGGGGMREQLEALDRMEARRR
jgi:hypothetical protein